VWGIALASACAWLVWTVARETWIGQNLLFAFYDDEGYLLLSLKSFFEGRPLYTETFTQYGPAFYWIQWLIYRIFHLAANHDTQRALNAIWIGCSMALLAGLVRRTAGSWLAAAGVALAAGQLLFPQAYEPGHPNTLIVTGLIGVCLAAGLAPPERRERPYWAALGAAAALLGLMKPHVGIIVALSLAIAQLRETSGRKARLWLAAALAAAAAFPAALMGGSLPYLLEYCLAGTVVLSILSVAELLAPPGRPGGGWAWAKAGAAGMVGTIGLVVVATLADGTSISAMWDSLIVRSREFARLWHVLVAISRGSFVSLGVSALAAVAVGLARRRWAEWSGWRDLGLAARVIWSAALAYRLLALDDRQLGWAHAWCWLHLPWGEEAAASGLARARRTTAWMAGFMTVYAYPIPGSQVVAAFVLLLPLAGFAGGDLWKRATELKLPGAKWWWPPLELAGVAALYLLCAPVKQWGINEWVGRRTVTMRDEGSRDLRMPLDVAAPFTWVTENLRGHCDHFYGVPGYGSLHSWSGLPPRTGWNATSWMTLLRPGEQLRVAESLRKGRACVVWNESGVAFWTRGGGVARSPLAAAIRREFGTWDEYRGWQILMRDRRRPEERYLLAGEQEFGSGKRMAYPGEAVLGKAAGRLSLEFRTRRGGVLLACQQGRLFSPDGPPPGNLPVFLVGDDGFAYGGISAKTPPLRSAQAVNDGEWRRMELEWGAGRQRFSVDGVVAAEGPFEAASADQETYCVLGSGYGTSTPRLLDFEGGLRNVMVRATAPGGTGGAPARK
jgi:4-amino-4-deoxy-L-arabinose transferase-like glycosyltransferase